MKNDNYFLNHAKRDLEGAFEVYFDLTFGAYDLQKVSDKKILDLSKAVKNEVYKKGGKFYELFAEIEKLKKDMLNIEREMRKDQADDFNTNKLCELYYDAISGLCELMFMYGAAYASNLERCLDDVMEEIHAGQ